MSAALSGMQSALEMAGGSVGFTACFSQAYCLSGTVNMKTGKNRDICSGMRS